MRYQLNKIGLDAIRQRGMPWQEYEGDWDPIRVMRQRTPGAIGCHFSQVAVMKKAQAEGKHAFVMEDDIIFCDDFAKRIEYIENWMKTNEWDVFWLGSSVHINPPFWHQFGRSGMPPNCSANLGYDAKRTNDNRILRTYGAFATFAYLVNKDSMNKIFEMFDNNIRESIGIDWLFCKIQPQLRCYAFLPGCTKQIDNQSDIGNGMTNWSGFLKLNGSFENSAYVYQDYMEQFSPELFDWGEAI